MSGLIHNTDLERPSNVDLWGDTNNNGRLEMLSVRVYVDIGYGKVWNSYHSKFKQNHLDHEFWLT